MAKQAETCFQSSDCWNFLNCGLLLKINTCFDLLLRLFALEPLASAFEGPEDTIAYLGEDVTIRCASETSGCSTINWSRRYRQSWGYENIFKNNYLINVDATRYSVNNSSGCHIVIRNIQYGDSGQYSCEAVLLDKTTALKSGYLIVLS